jgi:hypothetical protein
MSDDLPTYQTTPTGMQLRMRDSQSESGEGEERSEGVEQAEEGTEGKIKDADRLEEGFGKGDKRNSQTNRQGHDLHFLWW